MVARQACLPMLSGSRTASQLRSTLVTSKSTYMRVMRRLFALLLAASSLIVGSTAAVGQTGSLPLNTEAIDGFVEDYLDRHGLVGAAIAVVRAGRVLYMAGYGVANGAPVTPHTPMLIGSVSKPITAFAVLQLVDAGRIGLDDSVVEYLPAFEMDDERVSNITVRQLLSHTSGIPNPMIVAPADNLGEAVERLRDWQLVADPGQRYLYSNMNYQLAARLVEVVSGLPLAIYLEKHIFQPLDMDDTRSIRTTGAAGPGLRNGHVTMYGLALPVSGIEQLVAGSGSVVTTADDMSRWLAMITNGGRIPGGKRLLSRELLEQAMRPQPGANGYGLGWQTSGPGVVPPRAGHSGVTLGYSAQIAVVPGSGYGVVVMLNTFTPTYEHNYAITSGIIKITEGETPSPGLPIASLIDWGLGLLTLLVLALTGLGAWRARRWAARRSAWPVWRYALRLTPHGTFPALAVLVFLILPNLAGNSATMLDVLLLWPGTMVLLLALAASSVLLVVCRVHGRARHR